MRRSAVVRGLLLGGAVAGASTLVPWLTGTVSTVTSTDAVRLTGMAAAPVVASTALAVLVGAVVLAVSGRALAYVALSLVALAAAGGTAAGLSLIRNAESVFVANAASGALSGTVSVSPWAYAATAMLALVALFAAVSLVWVRRMEFARTKYDAKIAARSDSHVQSMDDWDALSEGADPSAHEGPPASG